MDRHSPRTKPRAAKVFLVALVLSFGAFITPNCCYADGAAEKNAQIEYITPDGQFSSVSAAHPAAHKSSAAFVDRDTISCVLREGETTFIIELPKDASSDRFTFLNENADACGELRIAVSDSALPADSPKWTEVDGIVPFAHKRLFKLSMLGVETKFVRLSFKVDGQHEDSARISDPFRTSFFAAALDSNFKGIREQGLDLRLTASVGALWTRNN